MLNSAACADCKIPKNSLSIRPRWSPWGVALLCLACLTSAPRVAFADAAQLLAEGIARLGDGAYAEALARFEAAGREVPAAPEPYFFAGAALNRVGRPQAALTNLDRATYFYTTSPAVTPHAELYFERG
jgi:Flp pilus assembly protein TadD